MGRGVLLLLTFILISFGEELQYNRYFLVDRIFLMPFLLKYSQEIGVREDQLESIKEFVKENEREVEKRMLMLSNMERRAKLMILEGSDEQELKKVLSDIASLKMELSLINARSVRFLKGVLTPQQFERLKNLIVIKLFELQQ